MAVVGINCTKSVRNCTPMFENTAGQYTVSKPKPPPSKAGRGPDKEMGMIRLLVEENIPTAPDPSEDKD